MIDPEIVPQHVRLLRELCKKGKMLYSRDHSRSLQTIPYESGEVWDKLLERGLIEKVRFTAPSEESPWSEYEVEVITSSGLHLLRQYGF